MQQSEIKKRIGDKACDFVQQDMIIGLGTGTTSNAFIRSLAERNRQERLKITCVASSFASEHLALSLGLSCVSFEKVGFVDVTFDGTDEIDEEKRLIVQADLDEQGRIQIDQGSTGVRMITRHGHVRIEVPPQLEARLVRTAVKAPNVIWANLPQGDELA